MAWSLGGGTVTLLVSRGVRSLTQLSAYCATVTRNLLQSRLDPSLILRKLRS